MATTYYVSAQTGNDSNNGTSTSTAKASIQAGLDLISEPGDIVYISPGTYRETVTLTNAVDGTAGDHIKIIGDPDCEIFTTEEKGVIRLTNTTNQDIGAQTFAQSQANTFYANKTYIEIHNLHIDGGGHDFTTSLNSARTSFGIRSGADGANNAFNCIVQNSGWCYYRTNTQGCISVGGEYGYYEGRKHVNSIALGGYAGFYRGDYVIDCIAIGGGIADFWYCDEVYNCAGIGGTNGFRASSGDIIKDSIAIACDSGFNGINQGPPSGAIISGSHVASCRLAFYRGDVSNSTIGPGTMRLNTSTSTFPNSSGFTIGSNNVTRGKSVLYSYNQLRELARVLKPDLLNEELRGKSDADNDSTRNADTALYIQAPHKNIDTDILGHPRNMGLSSTQYHQQTSKLSNRDIGPWEFSTVNYSTTYSQSADGIEIAGEGIQSFSIPVASGSAMTASVNTRWNSSHDTQKPGLILKYEYIYPSSSLMQVDTGQQYQTGSQLEITSTYSTAAINTWQNISVSVPPSDKDQIYQIQLKAGNTGSSNTAIFSDLEIT